VRIQIAGGLVREKDGRRKCESAGNGYALPLAAGDLVRKMIGAGRKLHHVEQIARSFLGLPSRQALQVKRQRHILDAGEAGEKIEELENKTNLVAAQAGQIVV
jgi:hypothetical protein